jgi:hypothetical protein
MSDKTETQASVKAIYGALASVMDECRAIKKEKESKGSDAGFRFKYRGIDDVYFEFHPLFVRNHIILGIEVVEHVMNARPTKNGVTLQHVLRIKFRFTSTVDGSFFESTTVGEASDTGDKGASKAISIGLKYLFFATFLLPTEDPSDDNDSFAPEWTDEEAARARQSAETPQGRETPAQASKAPPAPARPQERATSRIDNPGDCVVHFTKKHKGHKLDDLDADDLWWFAEEWQPGSDAKFPATAADKNLKACAQTCARERKLYAD